MKTQSAREGIRLKEWFKNEKTDYQVDQYN